MTSRPDTHVLDEDDLYPENSPDLKLRNWGDRGKRCFYCSDRADHVDHVKPRKHGGTNATWNLIPACRRCNLTKSAKSVSEWAYEQCLASAMSGDPREMGKAVQIASRASQIDGQAFINDIGDGWNDLEHELFVHSYYWGLYYVLYKIQETLGYSSRMAMWLTAEILVVTDPNTPSDLPNLSEFSEENT